MAENRGIVLRLSAEGAETVKRALRELGKDGEEALRRVERATTPISPALSAIDNVARTMKGTIVGLLGAFSFDRVMRTVGSFVNEASGLVKAADRIGVTTEHLQELHHAARLADIEVSDLDRAMQFFGKTLGEAAMGRGDLLRVLEANNVALRDEAGNIRSSGDLFADYADLIKNARSEQERLTLAQIAFGRGGIELVTMLASGSAGLRENAEEARRLGLVIRDDLLRNAEALEDDWTRFTSSMSTTWKSFVLSVVSGVKLTIDDLERLRLYLRSVQEERADVGKGIGALAGRASANRDFATGPTPQPPGELLSALGMDPDAQAKPTVLPTSGDGAGRGVNSAVERILRTIEALRHQADQLGRTAESQAVYNALMQAGIDENHAMAPEVMDAASALYRQQDAAKSAAAAFAEANRAMEEMRDLAGGVLKGFLVDLLRGKSLADSLADALANVGQKFLDSAINMFVGSLFPGIGAPMSILPPLFGPGRAAGGDVMPGRLYPVGERGMELFAPSGPGTIIPNHAIGGVLAGGGGARGPVQVTIHVTVNGTGDSDLIRKVDAATRVAAAEAIGQYDRALPERVQHIAANPRERF